METCGQHFVCVAKSSNRPASPSFASLGRKGTGTWELAPKTKPNLSLKHHIVPQCSQYPRFPQCTHLSAESLKLAVAFRFASFVLRHGRSNVLSLLAGANPF